MAKMNNTFIYLNGEIIPAAGANVHVSDLGLLRGYGIFDFLQNIKGVPLFIDDYLDRFERSAAMMDLVFPEKERAVLKAKIFALIAKNNFAHSSLRLCLTGGYSDDAFTPAATPNFFIIEQPIIENPDYQGFKKGEKLMLHEYVRDIYQIKSTNYVVPIRLQARWKAQNAIDVLYHKDGWVSESSRSNFFIVNDKKEIITPDDLVLHGITRKKVIALAQKTGYEVIIRPITLTETLAAKETFITSSTKGILPIVRLDDYIIGSGEVGEVTKDLMQKFIALQKAYIESQLFDKKGN
jgi:branched-chain amino acid aminotransferase